jgi:hypothetical protein
MTHLSVIPFTTQLRYANKPGKNFVFFNWSRIGQCSRSYKNPEPSSQATYLPEKPILKVQGN